MSEPLRILHVLNTVRETGNGIINTAIDLAWGQARAGHGVHVMSAGGEYEERLAEWGVTHHRVDQRRRPLTLWRARNALREIVGRERIDVVHAHMLTGMMLGRFAGTHRAAGGPLLVGHVHNVYQRSVKLTGKADCVLCCGTDVGAQMRAMGVPGSKVRVVLNGTIGSPRLPDPSSILPATLHHPAVVTVAGMNERKGISELIGAFAMAAWRHPDAHLYLVGDGPDRAKFEAEARATRCAERIHFEGFKRDPTPWLRAADLFVLASRRESFPIVLAEARAAGCAIVAMAVDGVPEALDGGKAGLLVKPPRRRFKLIGRRVPAGERLGQELLRLLGDPSAIASLRGAAQEGLEKYRVERMVDETLDLYRTFPA